MSDTQRKDEIEKGDTVVITDTKDKGRHPTENRRLQIGDKVKVLEKHGSHVYYWVPRLGLFNDVITNCIGEENCYKIGVNSVSDSSKCTDCNGKGEYIGLIHRETCTTCGGKG